MNKKELAYSNHISGGSPQHRQKYDKYFGAGPSIKYVVSKSKISDPLPLVVFFDKYGLFSKSSFGLPPSPLPRRHSLGTAPYLCTATPQTAYMKHLFFYAQSILPALTFPHLNTSF